MWTLSSDIPEGRVLVSPTSRYLVTFLPSNESWLCPLSGLDPSFWYGILPWALGHYLSCRHCVCVYVCVCVHAQSYLTLCDPMDCSLPGSSLVSPALAGRFFITVPPGKPRNCGCSLYLLFLPCIRLSTLIGQVPFAPLLIVFCINILLELLCGFHVLIGLYGKNLEQYTWFSLVWNERWTEVWICIGLWTVTKDLTGWSGTWKEHDWEIRDKKIWRRGTWLDLTQERHKLWRYLRPMWMPKGNPLWRRLVIR